MIYSRWRPDKGGYDYFETSERYGLGDDLPVPKLSASSAIGVASVDAGRVPPTHARFVGSGRYAKGMIMPTSRAGLSGTSILDDNRVFVIGLVVVGVAGYWYGRRLRGKAA
jgi:hypothetical protein